MPATLSAALIDELARAPERLRGLCQPMSPAELRQRPSPALFSPLENAWHLRDIEAEGYLVRIRLMLSAENPDLAGIDGDRLAVERRYQELPLGPALEGYAAARAASVRLLRELGPGAAGRRATLEGRALDLAGLAEVMAEHDRGHLDSIGGEHHPSRAA